MVGPSRNGVNKSPRIYRSCRQPWRHQDAYLLTLAPLSTGAKRRMEMNKGYGPRSLGGGWLGLLSGVPEQMGADS